MILIIKGQAVPNRSDLVVLSPTREYEATEYVDCALKDSPEETNCAFLAELFVEIS
jgi:hypothetical protein